MFELCVPLLFHCIIKFFNKPSRDRWMKQQFTIYLTMRATFLYTNNFNHIVWSWYIYRQSLYVAKNRNYLISDRACVLSLIPEDLLVFPFVWKILHFFRVKIMQSAHILCWNPEMYRLLWCNGHPKRGSSTATLTSTCQNYFE